MRTKWALAGVGVIVALIAAAVVAVVLVRTESVPSQEEQARAETAQWWDGARGPVTRFRTALADTRDAMDTYDAEKLRQACQQMHDATAVDIRQHLPAPNPELTSNLEAAIEDGHQAAHMCLSAAAGSMNSYVGEFPATLEQAQRNLDNALRLIDTPKGL
ncbi:Uncharacterised protein [Mycolicibacterium phlei]|jgi:hypothetical protein|uniref:Uncharacterized protein n=1 Tax=Mycolicibacterium phlei DSM 43239 = CCUG 21000 TaxID=1226750 RepID=A0A5N5VDG6_MYCPH|nr:hypothetical protein [Mycolicibacterium phlei]VEG11224.1 Uncharacterised protein [Mycobacteroides chelonae]AMO63127.1 hypothetical protein MPHLCCUG_04340 [Mycolicibacterium phlei]EID09617.1 hypothetical protein MPHLEI_24469 [Mycolicibacterium phlei RIVM601174]KAB7760002.1 hypothetical protein MPHL21000_02970 [Mycolicibacterium phlei DSM 43239 = CCUG 21000]KXW64374.1 hypothetical protein MPHL43072_07320 [Mycolicibacterium phlei DSM 43072]